MKGVIIYSVNINDKLVREDAEHRLSVYLDDGYHIVGQSQSGQNVVYTLARVLGKIDLSLIGCDGAPALADDRFMNDLVH